MSDAATKLIAVVSVSGGKDSTATALCALDKLGRDNCRFVFADTGNEHEQTLEYVYQYMPTVFGQIDTVRADFAERIANKRLYVTDAWPKKGVPDEIIQQALSVLLPTGNPFLDLCIWKGRFPSRKAQFCTQELKRYPLDAYQLALIEHGHEVESWRGIRRDESQNRKDAKDRELVAEGWTIVHPIAAWTAQETVDFVIGRGVELNPLYTQGMTRVGCMPCINCNKDELLGISKRFPEHVARIREWERLVCLASKRGWTTFFTDGAIQSSVALPGWKYDSHEKKWIEPDSNIYERMRVDSRIRWAETARGGRQSDFIRVEPANQCSSAYGLCE